MTGHPDEKSDDYALSRVPQSVRYSWGTVAVQRFGQVSSLHQFMLGSALGFGMTFWDAVLAITLGSVLLEVVTVLLGVAGVQEGLSTSVLARWSGFGRKGSALVGIMIALSLAGWFGVQNGVFAKGMRDLAGWGPEWPWAVLGGVLIVAITAFGFRIMAWTAYVAVPAFLILVGYSIVDALRQHSLSELIDSAPPGPTLSLAQGTTLVTGAFILGAIMTPDMTRFNRRPSDVVKQTLISVTLGEYVIGLTGVLLAHAARTADVVGIITTSSGVLGTLILATAIVKINDWNLYSSSLGTVNAIDVLFGRRVPRRTVTVVIGALGTFLSAIGIVRHFTDFLETIGILAPPVAGIIIAEYFVVRRFRAELERSRQTGDLPSATGDWYPLSLVCWAAAAAVGHFYGGGIPAINALVVAFSLYALAGRAIVARTTTAPLPQPATETPATPTGSGG